MIRVNCELCETSIAEDEPLLLNGNLAVCQECYEREIQMRPVSQDDNVQRDDSAQR